MNRTTCVRLRGRDGNYITISPSQYDESKFDLCLPSGTVMYSDVPKNLVDVIVQALGAEKIFLVNDVQPDMAVTIPKDVHYGS
jgi:hypothetical protein